MIIRAPCQKVLWRNGQLPPLGPKVAHTLAVLVARCDEVVSKQELAREVWRDTVVEDNSLAHGTLWYYNKARGATVQGRA